MGDRLDCMTRNCNHLLEDHWKNFHTLWAIITCTGKGTAGATGETGMEVPMLTHRNYLWRCLRNEPTSKTHTKDTGQSVSPEVGEQEATIKRVWKHQSPTEGTALIHLPDDAQELPMEVHEQRNEPTSIV